MKIKSTIVAYMALACCLPSFAAEKPKPLKVYLLAGQSNMTGIVAASTLEHLKMFPDTAKEFAPLFDKEGNPVELDSVYVCQWKGKDSGKLAPRFGGGKGVRFGPDFPFGVFMHEALNEPILIIKTSEGGKSLNYHFRPPSAGTWTPPPGHPDLIRKEALPPPPNLPIPDKLDLPADYVPGKDVKLTKKHMGLVGFKGAVIGKFNGVSPLYILSGPRQELEGNPFQKGDLILGVDGTGLRDDPIEHWRHAFYGSASINGDWMVTVTRWRQGKIETFDFDICDTIEGGRAKLPAHIESMKQAAIEKEKMRGGYYRDMIQYTKSILGDLKKHYPNYDEAAGYELAGFVWFQGYNDYVDGGNYPNRDKPRGYEQYSWLLEHFIRDIRKDLNAPKLPFVIGVMGVGGDQDPPTDQLGYFQQAQAAVAQKPEFEGTVVNVRTGKYWDYELEALEIKSREIGKKSNELKEQGLQGAELKAAYAEYRAKHITPLEEEILRKGVSNQGYHYLGSAKIMCGLGKAFAEAMIEIEKKQP